MKKIIFTLLVCLMALSLFAQDNVLIAAEDPWPPFVDPEAPTEGLSIEILRAAFKTQGFQIQVEYVPWARAINGVKKTDYDLIPAIWMTEERKEFFVYSEPYAYNRIKFIKLKDDDFVFNQLTDLKGKSVGIIRNYSYGNEFKEADYFTKDVGNDFITNIRKLLAGRFDLTLSDELVGRIKIARHDEKWLDKVEFSKKSLSEEKLYITVSKKHPRQKEIISAFNKGLAIIKENGTYDKILARYGIK